MRTTSDRRPAVDKSYARLELRQLGGERAVRVGVDHVANLGVEALEVGLLEDPRVEQQARKPAHRILLDLLVALRLRAVERLVVRERVAVGTDDLRVHERRAHPLAAVLGGVAQRVVGLDEVGSVDLRHEEVRESLDELRDRAAGKVDLDGNRDSVSFVFHQLQERKFLQAGDIERFPEFAFAGVAVAARHVADLVPPGNLAPCRRARRSGSCARGPPSPGPPAATGSPCRRTWR
jgi:hypothetical protein